MFPHTTKRTKAAVDQVGQTAWQMTYFLSSRAMWNVLPYSKESQATSYEGFSPCKYISIRNAMDRKNGFHKQST